MTRSPQRRETDGWFGWLTRIWDWIDKRDIDKHVSSWVIIYGTLRITEWCFQYARDFPNMETAAIIAAITVPWSALQMASLKWYFDSRQQNNGGAS